MCGVVGVIGSPEASRECFLGLTTLQHRGQDAAGILSYDLKGFHSVKNLGLVESVFTRERMENLSGAFAIGHTRYSTVGRGEVSEVQPFLLSFPFGLGVAHNGNIVNYSEIAQELRLKQKRHLLTQSDTEVLLNVFADALAKETDAIHEPGFEEICKAFKHMTNVLNGSYSVVMMIAGVGLVAFRDPHGIRPLVWGTRKEKRENLRAEPELSESLGQGFGILDTLESHIVASEEIALTFNGYTVNRNLDPGEVLLIDLKGEVHSRVVAGKEARPCMFEWVYFASPESTIDKVPVYGARLELGRQLGNKAKAEFERRGISPDVIVPVPETSRIAAIALSEVLGVPYRELLIKNRYIKRTFIMETQDKRQKAVDLKLSPVRSEIRGKKVVLVDDSIVRGTTSRKLVELVRRAGATEVYFVSTCPPIRFPCYYGIDFPSKKELLAHERDHAEIEAAIGADAVVYMDVEGLKGALVEAGEKKRNFNPCMACLTGEYPTDISKQGHAFSKSRTLQREEGS